MKDVTEAQIGDTLHLHNHPVEPLPGFKSAKPMVFAGEELTNPKVEG
jgi:translation elongation factor EF-4